MSKISVVMLLICLASNAAFCQDILDTERDKDAELFVVKQEYDVQQRLQEIKALEGQQVTIYQVSGKENKIKAVYSGVIEVPVNSKLSDKTQAAVLTVVIKKENKIAGAYFPLTNDKRYRIYLNSKMKYK
ncbi:MAG: hypothetical protein ACRYFX_01405 [Janthinobacterium lividum]